MSTPRMCRLTWCTDSFLRHHWKWSHKWWCGCCHKWRQGSLRIEISPLQWCLHEYAFPRKELSLQTYLFSVVLAKIEEKKVEGFTGMPSIIWVLGNHPIFLKSKSKLVSWRRLCSSSPITPSTPLSSYTLTQHNMDIECITIYLYFGHIFQHRSSTLKTHKSIHCKNPKP